MSDRILLFIPCYNCAPQIGRVLNQLAGPVGGYVEEVLILDNWSQDSTIDRAAEIAANITAPRILIARNRENFHLGGSHKAAFRYAEAQGFSHVVVLHGDDQGRLDDILPILEQKEHQRYDACLGARFMRGLRPEGYSRFRRFGNIVFNRIFSIVAQRPVHDLGSGLNIFGRAVFTDPTIERASDDLRFNVYILLGLIDQQFKMLYFPITWREEDQLSNVRLASQAWRTLEIAWEYFARRPHFRTADHRDRTIATYEFDVIARGASNA
jgi:glycosyltransferase involved in cell wall biosynthesis